MSCFVGLRQEQERPDSSTTAVAGSPLQRQFNPGEKEGQDSIPEGDRCYVYAFDPERGRELLKKFDLEELAAMLEEQQKELAGPVEKHFEPFWPTIGEEELTTKSYPFPFADGVITASVYYTDERMAIESGNRTSALETMLLCVALGQQEFNNACEAPGAAVAEIPAGSALKSQVMTRPTLGDRAFVMGMVCERPSAVDPLLNDRSPDNETRIEP